MAKATKLPSWKLRKNSEAGMGDVSIILGVHFTKASLKVQLEAKDHAVTWWWESVKTNSTNHEAAVPWKKAGFRRYCMGEFGTTYNLLGSLDKESVCGLLGHHRNHKLRTRSLEMQWWPTDWSLRELAQKGTSERQRWSWSYEEECHRVLGKRWCGITDFTVTVTR